MKILILAGGSGTRLWPFSRATFPKQFLKLGSERSFLENIVSMFLEAWNVEDIFLVTNINYLHLVKSQLVTIHPQFEQQILVEPERKSTGPAIALAVKHLQERNCGMEECLLVSSSDYFISPKEEFLKTVKFAEEVAARGKIVTFGVYPDKPETGYGYIKMKHQEDLKMFCDVEKFVEKPVLKVAEEYVQSKDYLWNSGIFAFQMKVFIEEMQRHAPEISCWMNESYQTMLKNFSKMPDISFDHSLMEKSENISVIPMNLKWSDIGCWDSIFDLLYKDMNQNAKIGNVLDIDTKNSLIVAGKRLISAIGIEDMVIVDTEDALLLGKRGESQRVKQLVEELKIQGKKESVEHVISHRPWGYYLILGEDTGYKVKRIFVNPSQKLSLQFHHYRSEHWVVVRGIAKVTKGEKQEILRSNESIYIPQKVVHRLENIGQEPLEIIEVQTGDYLGEDDIVRLEDSYGRPIEEKVLCEL